MHFLPPGVAHTTGLSHNPFTWSKTIKNAYTKEYCYEIICKINAPFATLVFPTIPLQYAKDQWRALSEGEIMPNGKFAE